MHGPIDSVYNQIRQNRIVEIQFISGEGSRDVDSAQQPAFTKR